MAQENTIAIKVVLENDLQKQFQQASAGVKGEAEKMSKGVASATADGAKAMEKNMSAASAKTKVNFLEMGANAKEFGQSLSSGNLPSAIMAFSRLTVGAFRSIGVAMAVTTGGLTILASAIAYVVINAKKEAEELLAIQEKAQQAQEKNRELELNAMDDGFEKQSGLIRAAAEKEKEQRRQNQVEINKDLLNKSNAADEAFKIADAEYSRIYQMRNYRSAEFMAKELQKWREANAAKNAANRALEESESEHEKKLIQINTDAEKKINALKKKSGVEFAQATNTRTQKEIDAEDKALDKYIADIKERDAFDQSAQAARDEAWNRKKAQEAESRRLQQQNIDMENAASAAAEASERARIENAYAMANAYSGLMGNLSNLTVAMKGDAELAKGLAITSAIINTAVGITKAFSQGGVLGFITGASIAAAGATQIATIQAQKFAKGGDFITSGPQMIMVGDNPGGAERVSVTPLSSPNYNGPKGGSSIHMGDIYITGNADASTVRALGQTRERQIKDLRRLMREMIAAKQMPSFA